MCFVNDQYCMVCMCYFCDRRDIGKHPFVSGRCQYDCFDILLLLRPLQRMFNLFCKYRTDWIAFLISLRFYIFYLQVLEICCMVN